MDQPRAGTVTAGQGNVVDVRFDAGPPLFRQLLPLTPERSRNLAVRPWPSRRRPTLTMAADRTIDEHLEERQDACRRLRQESITEEMPDVVTGFEAST